jgi:chaperonin cofactor prefoldin
MAVASPRMELVNDIRFLRQDNEFLLKEVMSLREQSTLLRDRSDELERKLRECLADGARRQTQQACSMYTAYPISCH